VPEKLPGFEDDERLKAELQALRRFDPSIRDWRTVEPQRCSALFKRACDHMESGALLATMVFVGTAQACLHGKYWAPSQHDKAAVMVDCRHLAKPMSRLYADDCVMPEPSTMMSAGRGLECSIQALFCHPLDACVQLTMAGMSVAMVHCWSNRDPRNHAIRFLDHREDQLVLRTTYYQAMENMESHLHVPAGDALDTRGLVHTPGVAVLRGPLSDGASWLPSPVRIDVIAASVPPNPKLKEQEQYACEEERYAMSRVVDRIFALAAAVGVDALVLPPLGCGERGCRHPALDVADIIHEAACRYAQDISTVCVASDRPAHAEPGWWDAFAAAVQNGRPAIRRTISVPVPPYPRMKKSAAAMAAKRRQLNAPKPRPIQHGLV